MNTFQAQIVKMVREMPDDALLDLVRAEMSSGKSLSFPPRAKAEERPTMATPRKRVRVRNVKAKAKRRAFDPKSTEKVLHAVKIAKRGVAIGDLEGYTKLPRSHVQRALGELLKGKRLFRAGDRRFTRYATTKAAAQKAAKAR